MKKASIILLIIFIFSNTAYGGEDILHKTSLRVPVIERYRIENAIHDRETIASGHSVSSRIEPYDKIQKSLEDILSDWNKLLKRRLSILFDPPYFDIESGTGEWIYRENIWNAVIDGEIMLKKALEDLRNSDNRDELIRDFAICDAIIWFLTVYLQEFHPDGVEGHNFFQERLSTFRICLKDLFDTVNANDPEQLIAAKQHNHRHYGRRRPRESWEDITAGWRKEFDENSNLLPKELKDDNKYRKIEFVNAEIVLPSGLEIRNEGAIKVRGFMVINAMRHLVAQRPELADILFTDKGRKLNCMVFNGQDELQETAFLPKDGVLRIVLLEDSRLPVVTTSKVSLVRPDQMLSGVVDLSLGAPIGVWISLRKVIGVFAYLNPAQAQIQFKQVLDSLPESSSHDIDSEVDGYHNKAVILLSIMPFIFSEPFKRETLPVLINHCMHVNSRWNEYLYEVIQTFGKAAPGIIEAEFQRIWEQVAERYPNVEGKVLETLAVMASYVSASVADPAFIFLNSRVGPISDPESLKLATALSSRVSQDLAMSCLPRLMDKLTRGYSGDDYSRFLSKTIASLSVRAGQSEIDKGFRVLTDALGTNVNNQAQSHYTTSEALYNLSPFVSDSVAIEALPKITDSYIEHGGNWNNKNTISGISRCSQAVADSEFTRVLDIFLNEKDRGYKRVRESEILRKLAPNISPAMAAQKLHLLINAMLGENEDEKLYGYVADDLVDTIVPMIKKVPTEHVTVPLLVSMAGILRKRGIESSMRYKFIETIGLIAQKSPLIAIALFDKIFDAISSESDYRIRCVQAEALASLAPAVTPQAAQERIRQTVNYYRTMTFGDSWSEKMQLRVVIKAFNAALFFANLRKLDGAIIEDANGKAVVKIDHRQNDMYFRLRASLIDPDTDRTIVWVLLNPILDREGEVDDPGLDTGNLSYFYIDFDINPEDIRPAAKDFLKRIRGLLGKTLIDAGNPKIKISKPGWINFLGDVASGVPIHDARQLEGILYRPAKPVNTSLLTKELDLNVHRFIGPEESGADITLINGTRNSLLRVPLRFGNTQNHIESSAARLIAKAFSSLYSADEKEIVEALEFLSALQIKEASPLMRSILDYPKTEVRIKAIDALGFLEDKGSFDKIASYLFANRKTDEEVRTLSRAILSIDYEKAWQFLFDNYNKLPHNSLRQVYSVFCKNIRPKAIPIIRDFVRKVGPSNLLVLTLVPALGNSGLEEARKLLREGQFYSEDREAKYALMIALANLGETWCINLIFEIFRHNPLIFGRMLYRANRSLGYRLKLKPELQAEFIPILMKEFSWQSRSGLMDPALMQLALIEAALALGRLGKKDVVPYLERCIETGHIEEPELEENIIDVLWSLKDERSIGLFEKIAMENIENEKGLLAIDFLIDMRAEASLRRLLDYIRNRNIDIREMAARALYEIKAQREHVPMRDISEFDVRLPDAVWVPVRVHTLDLNRKAQIEELLEAGVLLSWDDGVKRYPWWSGWQKKGIDGQIFFAPVRDPSFILTKDKKPYYSSSTQRSFIINNGTNSYVVKHCGADVPFAEGYLSMPYHYEEGVWLYGGELIDGDKHSREMENGLAIESVVDAAFRGDPVLKTAKAEYGSGEDVFLRPMLEVEPLFMPIGLLEGLSWNQFYLKSDNGKVAFLPILDALQLAGVKNTEQQTLYMYIYKNNTGVDERLTTYFDSFLTGSIDWLEFFAKRGYKKGEEGGAVYIIKNGSRYTVKEACSKTLQEMAARFGVFIRVVHDHLKRSCHRENGDIFTYQNTNEKVVFDYETFGLDGYTDINIRGEIVNAVCLINHTANLMGLDSEEERQAISIFRSIITGEIAHGAQIKSNSSANQSL